MEPAELVRIYNAIEPFIWYGFAAAALAITGLGAFRSRLALALLLVVFGTTDFFESEAWWTPWWLLLWKAAALGGIGFMVVVIVRERRQARPAHNRQ